ncbi:hypothetical protein D3C87_1948840 [compost metagenome]
MDDADRDARDREGPHPGRDLLLQLGKEFFDGRGVGLGGLRSQRNQHSQAKAGCERSIPQDARKSWHSH